jgi:hypothetical protein
MELEVSLVPATSGTAAWAIGAGPWASVASLLARPCDVHGQGPVAKLASVEHADGFLRFRWSGHFDERETLGPPSVAIGYEGDRLD